MNPVFIVGAPRSGTTLLYQLVCRAFDVAYIPNISNLFYFFPVEAARYGLGHCRYHVTDYKSDHGHEKGLMAPSEAGKVWNRWFPDEYVESTPAKWCVKIAEMVEGFQSLFNAPLVNKNVKHSNRIPALTEIFPEAKFIHVTRDPANTAISILQARRERGMGWYSVKPWGYCRRVEKWNEAEQVVFQVRGIRIDIERDAENLLTVRYEDLCTGPRAVMDHVGEYLNMISHNVPARFRESRPSRSEIKDWEIEYIRGQF